MWGISHTRCQVNGWQQPWWIMDYKNIHSHVCSLNNLLASSLYLWFSRSADLFLAWNLCTLDSMIIEIPPGVCSIMPILCRWWYHQNKINVRKTGIDVQWVYADQIWRLVFGNGIMMNLKINGVHATTSNYSHTTLIFMESSLTSCH